MRIQRLRTRIIVFFVALLVLVQLAAFALVNAANSNNAHRKVAEELSVGERVFERSLEQNAENLTQDASVGTGTNRRSLRVIDSGARSSAGSGGGVSRRHLDTLADHASLFSD